MKIEQKKIWLELLTLGNIVCCWNTFRYVVARAPINHSKDSWIDQTVGCIDIDFTAGYIYIDYTDGWNRMEKTYPDRKTDQVLVLGNF